ncbi:MAG: hypothetical protein ACRD0X_00520, partial [Thermoanaerobaculia bacterium]
MAASTAAAPVEYTDDFSVDDCTFANKGRQNPYFSLRPGDYLILEGDDDGELVRVRIEVKNATKPILFETEEGDIVQLSARVVEEREWIDEELVEVSRNWHARCKETNDVFYFGEDVDIYEDGQIVSHDGSWEAGLDGAQPGIIIPARFLLGSRYFQEVAPEVALDRAKHTEMGLDFTLDDETFDDCVGIVETTPLEPGHESLKA